jgi:hypothetical protein
MVIKEGWGTDHPDSSVEVLAVDETLETATDPQEISTERAVRAETGRVASTEVHLETTTVHLEAEGGLGEDQVGIKEQSTQPTLLLLGERQPKTSLRMLLHGEIRT